LLAGMLITAAKTRRADHRARDELKHAAASFQLAVIIAKSVMMYQDRMVQSMDRWVRRAVHARVGLKRDR
jgi:hypothetical protein